jgi:hypothetical protein
MILTEIFTVRVMVTSHMDISLEPPRTRADVSTILDNICGTHLNRYTLIEVATYLSRKEIVSLTRADRRRVGGVQDWFLHHWEEIIPYLSSIVLITDDGNEIPLALTT